MPSQFKCPDRFRLQTRSIRSRDSGARLAGRLPTSTLCISTLGSSSALHLSGIATTPLPAGALPLTNHHHVSLITSPLSCEASTWLQVYGLSKKTLAGQYNSDNNKKSNASAELLCHCGEGRFTRLKPIGFPSLPPSAIIHCSWAKSCAAMRCAPRNKINAVPFFMGWGKRWGCGYGVLWGILTLGSRNNVPREKIDREDQNKLLWPTSPAHRRSAWA